jgi:hypothetical protein
MESRVKILKIYRLNIPQAYVIQLIIITVVKVS